MLQYLANFATPLHVNVHCLPFQWTEQEDKAYQALKTTFAIEDSSKATRRGFEDWVETSDKGLEVLDVFLAFES